MCVPHPSQEIHSIQLLVEVGSTLFLLTVAAFLLVCDAFYSLRMLSCGWSGIFFLLNCLKHEAFNQQRHYNSNNPVPPKEF